MRVLVVQPYLLPVNGGNGLAAWTLQALVEDHDVTLLTRERPDLPSVNRAYGTSLHAENLRALVYEPPAFLDHLPFRLTLARGLLLSRRARAIASQFDLLFSLDDETDLGGPGIQYVHYPRFRLPRPSSEPRRWFQVLPILHAYYRLSAWVTGYSLARMRRNRTLVNSGWTAGLVRETHGIDAQVLWPPASGAFPDVDWNTRENGLVIISRLHPEKRVHLAIDIVEALRRRGIGLSLQIIGAADDPDYASAIEARERANASWLRLAADVSREDMAAIVTRYRYGIHCAAEEHFGMAPAELVRAGCIVFVPSGGGQAEIVARDERLVYRDLDTAAEKIARIATDGQMAESIRAMLGERKALLDSSRFVSEIKAVVASCR